jgi:hypothetical protein
MCLQLHISLQIEYPKGGLLNFFFRVCSARLDLQRMSNSWGATEPKEPENRTFWNWELAIAPVKLTHKKPWFLLQKLS